MNQPLAEAIFWVAALACALAELMILRSSFAVARQSKSELVPTAPRRSELTWAVVPALALCLLLLMTWRRVEARGVHLKMMGPGMDPGMTMPPAAH
jgi:hypothetical protein